MSLLPPDYINGNQLDASELNLMLSARFGGLPPIDPATRTASNGVDSIGAPASRWKDGHYSGNINADGQIRLRAFAAGQSVLLGSGRNDIIWSAPVENIGITVLDTVNFRLDTAGGYLVTLQLTHTLGVATQAIIFQERPINVTEQVWKNNFASFGGQVEAAFSVYVKADALDILTFKIDIPGAFISATVNGSLSIVKIH